MVCEWSSLPASDAQLTGNLSLLWRDLLIGLLVGFVLLMLLSALFGVCAAVICKRRKPRKKHPIITRLQEKDADYLDTRSSFRSIQLYLLHTIENPVINADSTSEGSMQEKSTSDVGKTNDCNADIPTIAAVDI